MEGTTAAGAVQRRVVLGLRVAAPAMIIGLYLWRIFAIRDPALRFFDDFFYYLVPAEHWVDGVGSTFFPGESTNGYHPLWFLWVALLYVACGDGGLFFALLDLSLMALMVGFYLLFERFLVRVTNDRLAAALGACVAAVPLAVTARAGVETALTVFVAALLLVRLSAKPVAEHAVRDAALLGALAALLVMSRLDAPALLFGLAVVVVPCWGRKRLAAMAIGALPLYVYLGFNLCAFGHLATSSMTAKTLAFFVPPNWYFLQQPSAAAGISMVAMPLILFFLLSRVPRSDIRTIALALATAPLLQFAAQALGSGWMVFAWYEYFVFMGLGLAAALSVVELRTRHTLRRVACIPLGVAMPVIVVLGIGYALKPDSYQVDIAVVARRLQAFSVDHPGIYAMGDAAGTPGWLVKRPIVQLEGLMMSHAFIDRIRRRQPLSQVFRDYHVDYYVATAPAGTGKDGCTEFMEPDPGLSSPRAPHMTATSCVAPVAVIEPGTRRQARVYRIDPATGRPG